MKIISKKFVEQAKKDRKILETDISFMIKNVIIMKVPLEDLYWLQEFLGGAIPVDDPLNLEWIFGYKYYTLKNPDLKKQVE